MFSNKIHFKSLGIKNRITLTFGLVFVVVTTITSASMFLILNGQNTSTLEKQYELKMNEVELYFEKLEAFTNKYKEKKLKLKFEPEIKGQNIVYAKPFDPGDEDFKYILHFKTTKNNLNQIALNTTGFNVDTQYIETYFKNISSKPHNILLSQDNKKSYFSIIKINKNIKGANFDVYILKNVDHNIKIMTILKNLFYLSLISGLLLILFMSRIISDRILKPIKNIINTSKEISDGDLSRRIKNSGTNDELEDLTEIINRMLDTINATFDKQSRFISDASHELRTPITIMRGYAELISRRYISRLSDEEKKEPRNEMLIESIDYILNESDNMTKLISSLLFLSKNDENQLEIMNRIYINSDEIMNQLRADYSLIPSHKFVIINNDNFEFYADKNLLLQSIRILIENAMKYSDSGTTIYISTEYKNGNGIISVKDNGYGIDENDVNKIFDRFYRIDESRNKNTGGHGLGLSIFKKIIEIQNQSFKIESKINVGTKISIIIKECKKN